MRKPLSRRVRPHKPARKAFKRAPIRTIVIGRSSGNAEKVSVPLGTEGLKALHGEPEFVGRLLDAYGEAVERSRRSGRTVRIAVAVEPGAEPQISSQSSFGAVSQTRRLADSLAAARARGQSRVAEILSGRDMLSADEFAGLIGTTRATVNTKRQKQQVLGLAGAKRGYRFPAWQIGEDGRPFEVLPALFERLGGSSWAVYRFLVQHHSELGGLTALQALQRGRSADVIDAAESVARDFS